MYNKRIGIIGEKIAQEYLIKNEFKIIETNFLTKKGEIDIIAQKENYIIFIEVKTRTNLLFGTPAMSINNIKKKHIKSAAEIYIYQNRLYKNNIRFDVLEVFLNDGKCKINHIKDIM